MKGLVGAFSVIVKTNCKTDGSSAALIEVLTVETEHAGVVFPGSKRDIRQYLADTGYVHVYSLGGGC